MAVSQSLSQIMVDPGASVSTNNRPLVDTTPLQGSVQRVTAGLIAPGQTVKQFTGKQASSTSGPTTVPLETVTAGKTFIITDIFVGCDSTTAVDIQITAGGSPIFRGHLSTTASIQMAGMETQPNATAGQQVNLVLPQTAAVQQFTFFISGVEQ
ncbi:MAG TPA: hypothetical protein VFE42_20700 [Chloroflexota bacterium]|nr:hypothetical protein [Chloroflexota bacterium]HZS89898.1 hypothetical protein [Chloroflexota bacterium]